MPKNKLLFTGKEWTMEQLEEVWLVIEKIATEKYDLDYYNVIFEVITAKQMIENYCSSGLPVQYPHWSFGKSFDAQYKQHQAGKSNLAYEIVINTDPCICYLMETNTMPMQTLVMAHAAVGHNNFFKNNYMFTDNTEANFIVEYCQFADSFIKRCEEAYGETAVMEVLDLAHALKQHSMSYKRKRQTKINIEEYRKEWQNYLDMSFSELDELSGKHDNLTKEVNEYIDKIPETAKTIEEYDLLYFFEKHIPEVKLWQKEIFRIVRQLATYFFPQVKTKIGNEGWACVDKDTEYLSPVGWKKISEYDGGEVAQYHEDGTITFILPNKYIVNKNKKLLHIKGQHIDQCVTPDHRMVYRTYDNLNKVVECRAEELSLSTHRQFINAGKLKRLSNLNITDEELKVLVAVVADGHFNPNNSTTYCQMAFTKRHKFNRMRTLLTAAGIEYDASLWSQDRYALSFYSPLRTKDYLFALQADQEQLEVILDEAVYWDGSVSNGRIKYCSSNKQIIDFLQYALSVTGHKSVIETRPAINNKNEHYVLEKLSSQYSTLSGGAIEEMPGSHTVYCFNVPTGMFVTRRNSKVSMTGNCYWHYTLCTDLWEQGYIDNDSYLEIKRSHTGVIFNPNESWAPSNSLNPYFLGFNIFRDIERICKNPTEEDRDWFPQFAGNADGYLNVLKDACYNNNDEGLIRNYLSPSLMKRLKIAALEDDSAQDYYLCTGSHEPDHFHKTREKLADSYQLIESIPLMVVTGIDYKDKILTITNQTHKDRGLNIEQKRLVTWLIESVTGYSVLVNRD